MKDKTLTVSPLDLISFYTLELHVQRVLPIYFFLKATENRAFHSSSDTFSIDFGKSTFPHLYN